MENKEIASVFKLIGQLMEIHDENKFKARSYSNAAFQIGKFPKPVSELDPEEFDKIPGVGKNLVPKLEELISSGEMSYLQGWLDQTPDGIVEMLGVKGLGPGKIKTIWRDMGIESVGELLYACNENRLVDLKGFGEKTQTQVKEAVEFMLQHKNRFLYASVEPLIIDIKEWVAQRYQKAKVSEIGGALRKDLILERLDVLVTDDVDEFPDTAQNKIKVEFQTCPHSAFEARLFELSISGDHLKQLDLKQGESFSEAYRRIGIEPVVPEMRDAPWAIEWAKNHTASELISFDDLVGCLHNHSTYSDGIDPLAEMATHLKNEGYEYLGICDHSKTAVYAGGLKEDEILQQHQEIEKLNQQLSPFKILKGIESDILMDGSLDYQDDVLASFDFIVASVHSGLRMDEQTATQRLIKAIENPYTSILGHPSTRLLLSRPGFPLDYKKIIDACAANNVVMELNANPMRLDIDYSWILYCMEKNVMIAINPDAHRISGFEHMRYGVMAARKGGLTTEMTLNALSLNEIEHYFRSKSN